MANEGRGKGILNIFKQSYTGIAIVVVVLTLILPMPKVIIDLCMIINMALAITILLVTVYTPRASNFSTFPRMILVQTIFGLGLNISSTRLILTADPVVRGGKIGGQSAMVQAFANVVTGGNNLVIGFVIFVILIVVQVVVVTKGATRISEVQARFSLDSMSQKMFDIDNRLNSGSIDADEAERLKTALRQEIDFYSTMDGASKFVSGNVKAGIFITVVNLIGGFIVGMVMNNLTFQDAMKVYSTLTIGDGLLSQLPAIMISFATGLLVTGQKTDEDFGSKLAEEFTADGRIYEILGIFLALTGIVLRNDTQYLLLPIGALFVYAGFRLVRRNKIRAEENQREKEAAKAGPQQGQGGIDADSIADLDPLSLELGHGLLSLVDANAGAEMVKRVKKIRQEAALDMGMTVPGIRIQDNLTLDANEYQFKINGIVVGKATARIGYYMCMDTGAVITPMEGERTKDPTFGMDAIWVPEDRRAEAEEAGYVAIDTATIISTHITEIIRANASDILGLKEVSKIMENVKSKNPTLHSEIMDTAKYTYVEIEQVLKHLLEERVSIRNITGILETLARYSVPNMRNPWFLTEKVRETLAKQICEQYADDNKKLYVMVLSAEWSEKFKAHEFVPNDGSRPNVAFDGADNRRLYASINTAMAKVNGRMPIILCPAAVRILVKNALTNMVPGIVVISENEVFAAGRSVGIEVIAQIEEQVEEVVM